MPKGSKGRRLFKGISRHDVWRRKNLSEGDQANWPEVLVCDMGELSGQNALRLQNFNSRTGELEKEPFVVLLKNFRKEFTFYRVQRPVLVAGETVLRQLKGKAEGKFFVVTKVEDCGAVISPCKPSIRVPEEWTGRKVLFGYSFWELYELIDVNSRKPEAACS